MERDSGIVFSRMRLVSQESSLLVTSHDKGSSSDRSTVHEFQHGRNNYGQQPGKRKEIVSFKHRPTASFDENWKNEESPQEIDTKKEKVTILLKAEK